MNHSNEHGSSGISMAAGPGTVMFPSSDPTPTSSSSADQSSEPSRGPNGVSASSTKDFTKRRNWPQQILSGVLDLIIILSPDGRFLYLSPSCKQITGYDPSELVGSFLTQFIHPQDHAIFVRDFNEAITTGNPLRFYLRFRKANGVFIVVELIGNPHMTATFAAQGMFVTCRPYPSGKMATVDAFLEHKMMSVELKAEVADLKRQLQMEETAAAVTYASDLQALQGLDTSLLEIMPHSVTTFPTDIPVSGIPGVSIPATGGFYPESSSEPINNFFDGSTGHENYNLVFTGEYPNQGLEPQSMMMQPDGCMPLPPPHPPPPGTVPTVPTGASGAVGAFPAPNPPTGHERVCHDCGVSESPEWRRGPGGPKTLCNACGLRWAKLQRKNATEK